VSYKLVDKSQDLGYGPAHYHTNIQVVETNEQLQNIALEEIKSNKEVYFPHIFDEEDRAQDVIETFESFLSFFNQTAELNKAIIFYMT